MKIIDHRRLKKHAKASGGRKRIIWLSVAGLAGLFVVANVAMLALYHNKALPGYSLGGVAVGGKTYAAIQQMDEKQFTPTQITLKKGATAQTLGASDLGLGINWQGSVADIKHTRSWLPLLSFVVHHNVSVALTVDQQKLQSRIDALQARFSLAATDKHIGVSNGTFAILPAAPGYSLDTNATASLVSKAFAAGKSNVTVAAKTIPAGSNTGNLDSDLAALQKQLQQKLTFNYGGQKVAPSSTDMTGWYDASGQTMAVSAAKLGDYLDKAASKLGTTLGNKTDLITAATYALNKNQSLNFAVSPATAVKRTYCTAVKGVPESELPDLVGKLAATYADTRGWNDGGKIAFKHVASGCNYTVWLAAPSLMTSFGSICDDYYNCQVGSGVVVNNDRWLYATDPWNKTGQSLEVYRTLIIDHESGHRLGFRDNPTCPGAGQPAPVMMQQSIDLKGCVFNVWPLQSEFDYLRDVLHVVS